MTQTLALLLDAYRDLNARRMFWIVLIISGLVAASFLTVGITPNGISVFWIHFKFETHTTPAEFYKSLYVLLGVQIWLTWAVTILAIISTASIFPEMISGGSIDLLLSKPIGRLRLFCVKYICGLLFVALQVGCFCTASFLVIGIRGSVWEPSIFLAIPIVVLFYSYIYCVSTLIGLWTRSTVTAILLTLLFWLIVFGLHTTERKLVSDQIEQHRIIVRFDRQITGVTSLLDQLKRQPPATNPTSASSELERTASLESRLKSLQNQREETDDGTGNFLRMLNTTMAILPKTSETVDLMERQFVKQSDLPDDPMMTDPTIENANTNRNPMANFNEQMIVGLETDKWYARRSLTWVIGTSLLFEAVILSLAAWIFCRRDY